MGQQQDGSAVGRGVQGGNEPRHLVAVALLAGEQAGGIVEDDDIGLVVEDLLAQLLLHRRASNSPRKIHVEQRAVPIREGFDDELAGKLFDSDTQVRRDRYLPTPEFVVIIFGEPAEYAARGRNLVNEGPAKC